MAGLTVWKQEQMNKLKKDMDRLFEKLWDECSMPHFPLGVKGAPHIDIAETEDHLVVNGVIPDLEPEDLDISIDGNVLIVSGEMRRESSRDDGQTQSLKREYQSFKRSFQLPCDVTIDEAKATFEDGILHIVLPKCKVDKAHRIEIKVKK